jgi:diguanylate cyclase (GGDEF)-like protein
MSVNKAEKQTVAVIGLVLVSFAAMRLFHGPVDKWTESLDLLLVSTLLGYAIVAFCFAMVLLGWAFFVRQLTRIRLHSASLFTVVGMLELAHALTFYGQPFYRDVGDTSLTMVYGAVAQVIGSAGLLVLLSQADGKAHGLERRRLLWLSPLCGFAIIAIVAYVALYRESGLLAGQELNLLRIAAIVLILGGYATAGGMILYRNRSTRPQALLKVVQAMGLLWFANLQMLFVGEALDANMLLAQLFKAGGYFFLMQGIYLVTIEGPMRQQKRAEAQIQYLAYHDELTGLGNRRLLTERLEAELNRARRSDTRLAVLLLDLDRFKTINDTLGHTCGDQLLIAAAERLKQAVAPSTHVYRMGGDEFTVLLPGLEEAGEAEETAARLLKEFEAPLRFDGTGYHITISIGVAVGPEAGDTPELLLQHADAALYSAKADRNAYRIYTPQMSDEARERLKLENDLRRALEENQFYLVYQPLVELHTGRVTGVEALLRWRHPERGEVPPSLFIPIAEETGLINEIGEWVIRTACRQNKAWQDAGLPPFIVSVNLSMRQFHQHDLADRVRAILEETGLEPRWVGLEITESMTADVEFAYETLRKLKEVGVQISLDDFGTGYSSLSYLKRYPIDKLKIDRSFVADLERDGNDAAIVSTIAAMARHLNLRVAAEGVESEEQLRFLRSELCEEAQGYYYTRPVPADAFVRWYEAHSNDMEASRER